jgi:Uma2 family endonuclease
MVATSVKRYSFEEYCHYDDGTNTRYELDKGYLQAMTPPSFRHILIADKLIDLFKQEIARLVLPVYCFREAGIRIGQAKSRIADLMVIPKDEVIENLDQAGIYPSTPLVIVEIVSPESISRDYRYKRSEYAAIAVPEYWIVDPKEGKVTVLIFNEGLYDETVFAGEEQIISPQFPDLKITPQALFTI